MSSDDKNRNQAIIILLCSLFVEFDSVLLTKSRKIVAFVTEIKFDLNY